MGKALKKIIVLLVSLMLIVSLTGCSSNSVVNEPTKQNMKRIGILQIVEHPSLNEIRESIIKQLEEKGFKDGENIIIDYQNAQGDQTVLKSVAQKFVNNKYDLIIAIATPSAQAVVSETKEIPILFSAVTDPIGAGIITNFERPGGNVTGTSNAVSAEKVMELAKQITPNIKKIGTIYNASETNAVWIINSLKEYAAKNNLTVFEATVTGSSEVQQAANSLVGKVDALFIPNDNTVATAMLSVSQIAIKAKLPVYVTADSLVRDGGMATYGINYTILGQETADMAVEVLNGRRAGDIAAKTMSNMNIYLNKDTAEAIGIELPNELLKEAVEVITKK